MLTYVLARLCQGLVGLLIVMTIVFAMARLSGDPATLMAPPQASAADIETVRVNLGLDRPVLEQYWAYLSGLFHGDLGTSTSASAPVADLLWPAFQETAHLALVALLLAVTVGLPLGFIAGIRAGGRTDLAVRVVALLGQSIPSFWLGIVLVMVFAVWLGVLPALGSNSGLTSVILPATALAAFPLAASARLTRSSVVEVMRRDFVTFVETKGVPPRVVFKHIARNASLPVVTLTGIQIGQLISATIIVETLFAWPGLGQLAIQAINARDYQLLQGIVVVDTVIFVALLFVVDLSYGYLDPRVRRAQRAAGS
ncbi:ABC transporter permease [Mycolicibacterium sp.]|uniref:ABC transporter permease n=1 Tax=Mycolicibacterium sp. TaxID=2320850 RepID=UPI003D143FD5